MSAQARSSFEEPLSEPAGVGLLRRVAGNEGIRAHQHHGGERLSAGRDADYLESYRCGFAASASTAPHAGRRHRMAACWARGGEPRSRSWSLPPDPAGGVVGGGRLGRASIRPNRHRLRHGRHDREGLDHREWSALMTSANMNSATASAHAEPLYQGRRLHAEGAGRGSRRSRRRRRLDGGGRRRRLARRSARRSAGADPGPACYGLGNVRPTVTDANLVLGFLNPTRAGRRSACHPAAA